jgi:type IV pilus assembly protein PilY1
MAKRMSACVVAACLTAQPAFAAVVDISNTPLGSSAGAGFLPNLLFILDDSGSMASDYNPDYVNDNNTCMTRSGSNTNCTRGDPPYEAGGQNGFNGVGYDPNFTYQNGLTSNGQPVLNPPTGTLTPTSVTADAYLGGGSVNVTSNFPDKTYCNPVSSNAPCKRSGADTSGTVTPAGTLDAEGNTLAAGQFPYRANVSSQSTINFGLPEMMTTASFTRSSSTVTATSIGKPSLAVNDKVYVTTANAGLNVACATVTAAGANSFTYTAGSSGTIAATNGSYRKCVSATWTRSSTTVTVTGTHGLQNNDQLLIASSDGNQSKTTATPISVTSTTTFTYTGSTSGSSSGTVAWVRTGLYNVVSSTNTSPAVYRITPLEYCRDVNLTDCVEVIPPAAPVAPYTIPAYVRFCRSQQEAISPGAVTFIAGTPPTPRCQLKYVNVTGLTAYIYPRYGRFNRDTVVSSVGTYGNRPGRSDCAAAPTCTYTEEIQNYAKWYTYFRTRMQMMKTSAGRSFLPFISNPSGSPAKPDRLRVGFITINPTIPNGGGSAGTDVLSSKYLKIDTFNATQASNWYTKFYSQIPNPSTPLRLALSRAGWIFAGKLGTGLTSGIPTADDPIQASCQKNYSFLTTDGFWNQGTGQDLNGTTIGNLDNVDDFTRSPYASPDFFVSRANGQFDGNLLGTTTAGTSPGGAGTLADIALYYYMTDLRNAGAGPVTSPSTTPSGGDVSTNNVSAKTGSVDFATHQHMNTYTIGLADGLMRYQSDYPTASTGDFNSIKHALTASGNCFWASGTCNWPSPQADGQSALDDLWHAAVNGRGQFYSAVNPNLLATGLSGALNNLDVQVASAAAAATSSPQVSQGNNKAFSTTYQTATWSGRVFAQNIDPLSGDVLPTVLWEAHTLLLSKVAPSSDTRTLLTRDPTRPNKLKDFRWADVGNGALSAAEQAFFTNKCIPLSNMAQCNTLTPVQLLTADDGSSLVGFLRGQTGNEATVFRDRTEIDPVTNAPVQTILGDIVNAQPIAVRPPFFIYENESTHPEPAGQTYPTFRTNNATRVGPLLIGANDGFLHAFDPNTGIENWAYVPRFLMPSMYQLADSGYPGQHRFFVDGTPETTDVFDANAGVWKTIVVGGTNAGGRGFYALDITDPVNPKGLWEFCSDSTLCPTDASGFGHSDADLGLSYGNPVIGRRASDGRWVVVVTSGLNNVSTGTGVGYFYVLDAITGQILHKVSTGVGDTTTPAGLMKIGAYYPDGIDDPNFTHVFGGDQLGNVWRLDMSQAMASYPSITSGMPFVGLLAQLKDSAGRIQPITARPAGTHIGSTRIYYVGTGRYLGNSDLSDPGAASGLAWQQSIYAIKDQLDTVGFTANANFRNGNVVKQTLAPASGGNRTISKNAVDWMGQDGYYVDLNPTFPGDPPAGNSPGERVTLDVRLIQGTLIVTSTVPNAGGGCVPGGNSFQYGLDFRTGGYVGNDATAVAGLNVGKFLVGAAIIQTSDNRIKALNKTITGENVTTPVSIDVSFQNKRFSYRER